MCGGGEVVVVMGEVEVAHDIDEKDVPDEAEEELGDEEPDDNDGEATVVALLQLLLEHDEHAVEDV